MHRVILVMLGVIVLALSVGGSVCAQAPHILLGGPYGIDDNNVLIPITITRSGPVIWLVYYSEIVSDDQITLTAGDVTVNTTGTVHVATKSIGYVSDENGAKIEFLRAIVLENITGDGKVSVTVAEGTAPDANGDPIEGVGPSDECEVDNTSPVPTIELLEGQLDKVDVNPASPPDQDNNDTTKQWVKFKVTFNEEVTGFEDFDDVTVMDINGNPDCTRTDGTLDCYKSSIFSSVFPSGNYCHEYTSDQVQITNPSGDSKTFEVSVRPRRDCTVTIEVPQGSEDVPICTDAVGNPTAASNAASVLYNDAPHVRINSITPDPTNSPTITYTFEFSEPVDGFGTGDVTIGGTAGGAKIAVVSGLCDPGSGCAAYTVGVSGMTYSGNVSVSLGLYTAWRHRPSQFYEEDHDAWWWQYIWPSTVSVCGDSNVLYDGKAPNLLTVNPPIVTDTGDSYKGSYATNLSILSIGGNAGDDVGISQVTWSNDRGGSGDCTLDNPGAKVVNWSQDGILLKPGRNVITITALDAAGNALRYVLTVDCTNEYWSDAVDPSDSVGEYTSLALDASGNPRISYYDSGNGDLKYAAWNGQEWDIQTVDGNVPGGQCDVGKYTSLKLDSGGNPHIGYYDDTNKDLKYAYWKNGTWHIQTIDGEDDSGDDVGEYTSLALDPVTDRPRIAYYDGANSRLMYVAWNGSSWDDPIIVDDAGDVGRYASLALDADGNPRISYHDATNSNLKYAAWNGSSWVASTVAVAGDVGRYTSLALDADGSPCISYYDASNGDLKYAAWDGSSIWVISTVDTSDDVGQYSSLRLGLDGNPRISYYDVTNGDLKLVKGIGALDPNWETPQTLDDGIATDSGSNVGKYCSLALAGPADNAHISYYDSTAKGLKYIFRSSGLNCVVTSSDSSPTKNNPITFTITFSSDVTGLEMDEVIVTGATKTSLNPGPGVSTATYQLTVTPIGDGEVTCRVLPGAARAGILDNAASNTAAVVYDGSRPAVTIDQMHIQLDPTNGSPIYFTVVFSEPVTGFTGEDILISGSAGGAKNATVTGNGSYYNVTVTGMTTAGSIIAGIPANVVMDAVGNYNLQSTSTDNTVWYDNTPPTCTINQASGLYDGPTQGDPTNSPTIHFTAVFSETVWRFHNTPQVPAWTKEFITVYTDILSYYPPGINIDDELVISGSASFVDNDGVDRKRAVITPIGVAGAPVDYTTFDIEISGMQTSGTVIVSVPPHAAYDFVKGYTTGNNWGNINWMVAPSTSTDNSVTYDPKGPTVTINQSADQPDPTNASPIRFSVKFSKDVTGFTGNDVQVTGTAVGNISKVVTGSGKEYNVSISGMQIPAGQTGPASIIVAIPANAAHDSAGNGNPYPAVSNDNIVWFDDVSPTVTVEQASDQSDSALSSPINFIATFSEPVSGFGGGDVIIEGTAGATTATVTQIAPNNGTTYKVAMSGMASNGTITASINEGTAQDALGNLNEASASTDNTVYFFPEVCSPNLPSLPRTIPDNNLGGITIQRDLTDYIGTIRDLNVKLSITHAYDRDLKARLIGPDGTEVELFTNVGGNGTNFTNTVLDDEALVPLPTSGTSAPFTGSYKPKGVLASFDGRSVSGIWTLKVVDDHSGVEGMLVSWCLQFTVDETSGPTVTIDQAPGQADPTQGEIVDFTAVFSRPVTGFGDDDIFIEGTAEASVAEVTPIAPFDGTAYNIAVSGMVQSGTVIISIPAGAAQDLNDIDNVASTVIDDTVQWESALIVMIDRAVSQVDPTNASPVNFKATFNRPVTDFTSGDVHVYGSANPTTVVVTPSGASTTFNVAVYGMTISGNVAINVYAGAAHDVKGFPNEAAGIIDNTVVYDKVRPTVTVAQTDGQADPANAGPIDFTVVFSEEVADFSTGDVTVGGTAGATSAVVTGSGTTYDVTVTGMTANGTVTLSVPANVAHDAAGNSNTASTSQDNSVTYDAVVPTVTINQAAGQLDPTSSSFINFTVVFSERVIGFATGDVTVGGTAGANSATVSEIASAGGTVNGTTYRVVVTGMTTVGTVTATIAAGVVQDAAGNLNSASTSTDNTVDYYQAAGVTVNQADDQADPTNASPIDFTVVFDVPVTGFTGGDVTMSGTAGGTKVATVTGSGTTYNVAVSGMTPGTVIVTIPAGVAQDASGNGNAASTSDDNQVTYDNVGPTVAITTAQGQADPTKNSPINFKVEFSEAVSDFTASDVTISGTAVGTKTAVVTGSGMIYNVAVSGMTGPGTVCISVAACKVHDDAVNCNTASSSVCVTYDNVAPTVTINQAVGQSDPTATSPINFSVVFSELVTGFAKNDILISGSAGGTKTVVVAGSGATYTVAVSGMTTGTVIASIPAGVAQDAAGNTNTVSTSTDNTVIFSDGTSPTVTVNQAAGQPDPTNNATINFAVVFNRSVVGFTSGDVIVGGTAGGTKLKTVTGGPQNYNVAVTGMTSSGTVTVTIPANKAQDLAGNYNAASTSTDNVVMYDISRPTVTVDQAADQDDPASASPVEFTVVFSKAVTGFEAADVVLGGTSGPTGAVLTGSGTTYTVTVSGMVRSGTVTVSIPDGVAQDGLGYTSTASTSIDNTVTFDRPGPTVTIDQADDQPDPTKLSPIDFTVIFSEPVYDFTSGDVTTSGTAPGKKTVVVTGSGTTYNVAVSGMTASGTVIASIAPNVAHDTDGFGNAEFTSTDNVVNYDLIKPSVTIDQAVGQADPTKKSPINYTVVFSKPVTGFTANDVIVTGTAGGIKTFVVTGSGTTYNVAVRGITSYGTVIAKVGANKAQDAAGNGNLASTSTDNVVIYDNVAPTVTITSPTSAATYETLAGTPAISGTASDNATSVKWASDRGKSGTCMGTSSWGGTLSLVNGVNVITVTAYSSVGLIATDTLTVTYTAKAPTTESLSPNTGTIVCGIAQTFASQYSDDSGVDDLAECKLLINTALSGANAIHVRYDANNNKLYVRNDANSAWLGGYAPGASSVIENGYCRLICAETTKSVSGSRLTINWKIEPKAAMSGKNCSAWLRATDDGGLTSDWNDRGSLKFGQPPVNSGLTPNSAVLSAGVPRMFVTTYTDSDGYADITECRLLINSTLSSAHGISVMYNAVTNKLYVRNDANTGWVGGFAPGTANVIVNSSCKLYCVGTSKQGSGATLWVSWKIEPTPAMVGKVCGAWMRVKDRIGLYEDWMQKGTIGFSGSKPPKNVSASVYHDPLAGDGEYEFTCRYSDPDGRADLSQCVLLVNSTARTANAAYVMYDSNEDKFYLRDDDNTEWLGGFAPGSDNIIENGQCQLMCALSSAELVDGSTTDLNVKFYLFFPIWTGSRNMYMFVYDDAGVSDGWDNKGSFNIE